jgi:5-methylcytosine-specific restriction endonuclease McrA
MPGYKRAKKAWRLKRKAIERGATIAEKFHPFDIFDRDGWKCQICGTKTPKALRGTYKPNAPELDHIVPISKGGAHHPSNCQTSCRSCNARKSDGMPMGQIGLFTSLIAA